MTRSPEIEAHILVVDDEHSIVEALAMILQYAGYRVSAARSGAEAIDLFQQLHPDLVLLDVKMPGMDGIQVLRQLMTRSNLVPIVMLSGHATISTAVQATKLGACDFLEKPLDKERILLTIRNHLTSARLEKENLLLRKDQESTDRLIGSSPLMNELRKRLERVAPSNATVLITGPSGTGKELIALTLHERSNCRENLFVQVNCAAIPENLIENELFGHEKGSYTGAAERYIGKFELADKGTIFLDEIGDMSLQTQAKVLRVLESGDFQRVGGKEILHTDARVIAATNKDIEQEIKQGRFRADLYFRLNVVPVVSPALADHASDIPELVTHFCLELQRRQGLRPRRFTEQVLAQFQLYHWPGNVRELRNLVERLQILAVNDPITLQDLESNNPFMPSHPIPKSGTLQDVRDATEKDLILIALRKNNYNVKATANTLKTTRSNLYKKLKRYQIDTHSDKGS